MSRRENLLRRARVGSQFLVVGAISTIIEIAVFNLCLLVFGWPVWIAKTVASLVALVNAYFGNREWAFRHRGKHGRVLELVLFLAANAVCTVLGVVIVTAGAWAFDHPGALIINVINLFSIGVVVVVRFALYHFVVFPGQRRGGGGLAEPGEPAN